MDKICTSKIVVLNEIVVGNNQQIAVNLFCKKREKRDYPQKSTY